MGTAYNPSIVTRGLRFCVDFVNKKSYAGSGTSAFDLSPNLYTGTVTNSPTYNADSGSFTFDGVNDYVEFTTTNIASMGPGFTGTIEIIFQYDSSGSIQAGNKRTGSNHGYGTVSTDASVNKFVYTVVCYYSPPYAYLVYNNTTLTNGNWYHAVISLTVPSSSGNILSTSGINGVFEDATTAILVNSGAENYPIDIGRHENWVYGTTYGKGKIALFKIYNVRLTTEEMLQNYFAYRGRFNI